MAIVWSHWPHGGKDDANRSGAVDALTFVGAIVFTLAPFALAKKFRKAEAELVEAIANAQGEAVEAPQPQPQEAFTSAVPGP